TIAQESVIKSKGEIDEISSQEFYNSDSLSLKLFQSAFESENQLEVSDKLFQNKTNRNNMQIFSDQSLKVPDVEILTNNVKSNSQPSNVKDLEWPLLGNDDDDPKSESDNTFELPIQAKQQRKDGQHLSDKLLSKSEWNELNELILLFSPLPINKINWRCTIPHSWYNTFYYFTTNLTFLPLMEAYIAFYLDPQFKNISFTNNKKKEVADLLSEMIKTNNTLARTEIDQFFDGEIPNYVVDDELE
ncbi:24122_t:CDS:2, partial [Gigaspora margarita]